MSRTIEITSVAGDTIVLQISKEMTARIEGNAILRKSQTDTDDALFDKLQKEVGVAIPKEKRVMLSMDTAEITFQGTIRATEVNPKRPWYLRVVQTVTQLSRIVLYENEYKLIETIDITPIRDGNNQTVKIIQNGTYNIPEAEDAPRIGFPMELAGKQVTSISVNIQFVTWLVLTIGSPQRMAYRLSKLPWEVNMQRGRLTQTEKALLKQSTDPIQLGFKGITAQPSINQNEFVKVGFPGSDGDYLDLTNNDPDAFEAQITTLFSRKGEIGRWKRGDGRDEEALVEISQEQEETKGDANWVQSDQGTAKVTESFPFLGSARRG